MKKLFVPNDFQLPEALETEKLRLRKLTADDVDKDYDAVVTSIDHLKGGLGNNWPQAGITKERDLSDLKWHEKEFNTRRSFAYTVVTLDETKCLGCVYICPTKDPEFDAEVYVWVRKSEVGKGLDEELYAAVRKWVREKWPFERVIYPGREISWDDWNSKSYFYRE